MMRAYCFASGHIHFGRTLPSGAIVIARGVDEKALIDFISAHARHGYDAETVAGRNGKRLAKKPGTDCLLVPGVPEAPNQAEAMTALEKWLDWLKPRVPESIMVI